MRLCSQLFRNHEAGLLCLASWGLMLLGFLGAVISIVSSANLRPRVYVEMCLEFCFVILADAFMDCSATP